MSNIPKGVKGEYAIARSLCLYGNGDGRPIASADKLAELSGLHVNTIRVHLAGWLKEREEIVANSGKSALRLELSEEDGKRHKENIKILSNSIARLGWELQNFDKIIEKFDEILKKFTFNTENGDQALVLFDKYLQASANRQALEKHFITLQNQWNKLVGVDSLMDVGLTRAKEDTKLAAKLEAKKAESEVGVRDVTPAGLQVFQRNQ